MNIDFIKHLDLESGGIFIIMVGPPGSGKTTIAEQLEQQYNFVRICPDDIREELTGDASCQTRNEEVFNKVYQMLSKRLTEGFNVVYDATNCRSNYRIKILDIVHNLTYKTFCFCSTTPISECLDRNKNRYDRQVPEEVIERMYFTLKKHPPTIFEGYDGIFRF